jgi:hypothetical protein
MIASTISLAEENREEEEPVDVEMLNYPPRLIVGLKEIPAYVTPGGLYLGAEIVRIDRNASFILVESDNMDLFNTTARLDRNVRYIEFDAVEQTTEFVPNDVLYPLQENLQRIRAPDFWQYEAGNSSHRICMIDSGFNVWHSDLSPTFAGGYDYWSTPNDGDPHTPSNESHGTMMASIAASAMNNAVGIAPVARVGFFALKSGNNIGVTASASASGMTWCGNSTARVYSMSFGGGLNHTDWYNGLSFAWNHKNAVLVASAGNQPAQVGIGLPAYNGVYYPGRYDFVIGVGCLNSLNDRCISSSGANQSQAGPQVDVAAPGQNVLVAFGQGTNLTSTWKNVGFSGATSEATAHVAGLAALLISRQPNLTNQVVKDLIEEGADDVNVTGWDEPTGWGIVNASKSLAPLLPASAPTCRFILPKNYGDSGVRTTLGGTVNFTAYIYSANNTIDDVELWVDGSLVGSYTPFTGNIVTDAYYMGNYTYYQTYSTTGLSDGVHEFKLRCTETDTDERITTRFYSVDN